MWSVGRATDRWTVYDCISWFTKSAKNQFCKNHLTFPKWKLSEMSSFKTIKASQCEKWQKSVLTRPPHSPEVKMIEDHSCQFFQEHHNLPRWKLSIISPCKASTPVLRALSPGTPEQWMCTVFLSVTHELPFHDHLLSKTHIQSIRFVSWEPS